MSGPASGAEGIIGRLLGNTGELGTGPEVTDWSVGGRTPSAVAFPETVDELSSILFRATEEGWAVVPAGAGGWIGGGGGVERLDLVITSRGLTGIVEYEPDDLTLTARAGTPLSELRRVTRERGQWLPLDPPGAERGTLGALVATGLAGPLSAGFGRPRDHLLGVTVVTGDGRVLRPGGRVVKNVAGFDLVRLVVGSWGTLGVVAEASLRLFPLPDRDLTLLYRGAGEGGGGGRELTKVARRLATAPVAAASLELLRPLPGAGREVAHARRRAQGAGKDGAQGGGDGGGNEREGRETEGTEGLALRLLGREEEVEGQRRLLEEAAGRLADEVLEGDASRTFHDSVEAKTGTGEVELRLALPPARLGRLLEVAEAMAAELSEVGGGETSRGVHVASGVLRIGFEPGRGGEGRRGGERGDRPELGEAWIRPISNVRARLEEEGGSLALLRGPDPLLRRVGPQGRGDGVKQLEEGLRRAFDPGGVLVPGRWVP